VLLSRDLKAFKQKQHKCRMSILEMAMS